MKIITILDSTLKELKKFEKANLYGITTKNEAIICTTKPKKHLSKIGVFQTNQEGESKTEFYFKEETLFNVFEGEEQVVNVLPYHTDFHKRNAGIIDPSTLQEKTVLVIGSGGGGSGVIEGLVRAGVENFIIIEFDTVSISNLCRSNYDLFDVGKKKTETTIPRLLRINPCINVEIFDANVLEMDVRLLCELILRSDLVVDATDSPKTKTLINGLTYHKKPVLYPAVYEQGKGGDILFTIPKLTPCYECVFSQILPQMEKVNRGEWDYSTDKLKPMAGLGADINIVVARSVKIALALLMMDVDDSLFNKIIDPQNNMLFIGNEKFWIFTEPFQEVWAKTEINPECTCQTLK